MFPFHELFRRGKDNGEEPQTLPISALIDVVFSIRSLYSFISIDNLTYNLTIEADSPLGSTKSLVRGFPILKSTFRILSDNKKVEHMFWRYLD